MEQSVYRCVEIVVVVSSRLHSMKRLVVICEVSSANRRVCCVLVRNPLMYVQVVHDESILCRVVVPEVDAHTLVVEMS